MLERLKNPDMKDSGLAFCFPRRKRKIGDSQQRRRPRTAGSVGRTGAIIFVSGRSGKWKWDLEETSDGGTYPGLAAWPRNLWLLIKPQTHARGDVHLKLDYCMALLEEEE